MKLKHNIPLAGFLKTVDTCAGEVYYNTDEGDVLNLKSQLCRYLFLAALSTGGEIPLSEGEIVCADPYDYALLREYLLG